MNDIKLKQLAIVLGIAKAAIGLVLLSKYSYSKKSDIGGLIGR